MSRQLTGIGPALSSALAVSNKTTFKSIMDSNPRDLESILNRPPPTGDNLKAEVAHLPQFELRTETVTNESATELHIYVDMTNCAIIQAHSTAGKDHWIFLLVGDSNNKCIYKERFRDTRLLEDTECWRVEIKDPSSVNEVYVDLISEQWVGLDVHSSIKLPHPRQTIPLEAKNSIGRYLKKQGLNKGGLSSKPSTPQAHKRSKSSIVDQIKEMSERRLGNVLSPNALTLKTAYTPAKRAKLLPLLGQKKSREDEQTDDIPQLHNPDRRTREQMDLEIHTGHVKPKLIADKEISCLPSGLRHTSTDVNELKEESIDSYRDADTQLYQLRIMKCNAGQEHSAVPLQDGGTHHAAALQTAHTGSEYTAHTTQNQMSCNDFNLLTPSTSNSTEHSQTPFEENTGLYEGEESLETGNSVAFNSQVTDNSSAHNSSFIEQCNSEDCRTQCDAHCSLHNRCLQTGTFQANAARESEQPSLATMNDDASVHTEQTHRNIPERKRTLFQRTLPRHYYPVFMKSLQPDMTGCTELSFPNCDHVEGPSDRVAGASLMQDRVTCPGVASECGADNAEPLTKRDDDMQPLPGNEASVPKPRSPEGSPFGENRERRHYPVPNFHLVEHVDSFLAAMFTDDSAECKAANTHNDDSFVANAPAIRSDSNKFVSRAVPENSSRYVHRITRNESKYEPILNSLLKDVSRKEIMSSSSTMEANEKYNTKVSSSSSQFQFQSQSQTNYVNLGAKNKRTLSHFTQEPQNCDSLLMMTNQNIKHVSPLRNFTQTLQTHNSDQSDYCNSKQRKFNYQPSVLQGYTNTSSDSDCTPHSINRILQTNDISTSWNDAISINTPINQPPSFIQKKSYTQIFEFGNSLCTQPQLSPIQDNALYPTDTECSPNLNSQWQKFQMSPISSDNSPEVYY
jgi:hypothetical protein